MTTRDPLHLGPVLLPGSQTSWGFPIYASGERLFATGAPVNLGQCSNPEADKRSSKSRPARPRRRSPGIQRLPRGGPPVLWMPSPFYQITAMKKTLNLGELDATGDTWPEDWSWQTETK